MLTVSIWVALLPTLAFGDVVIPDDTTVYLTTAETVIGKKDKTAVGQVIRARVWRDVIIDGEIVIRGGTAATAKVSALKSRGMFGTQGQLSLSAVETTATDGQSVQLTGGYHKEGGGRMLLSLGIGVLVFWPALFVVGKAAELPEGTVMDSFTLGSLSIATAQEKKPQQIISLSSLMSNLSVEVLYEELSKQKKPKDFDFLIAVPSDAPDSFVIDVVNGVSIKPIQLKVKSIEEKNVVEEKSVRASVAIKQLVKVLRKGINTFEVSYGVGVYRVAEEVILQIEI